MASDATVGAPGVPARPGVSPWVVTIAVMLPTFMEVLDTSIVNVALPHMQGSFSATQDEITWVLTSYLVSNAIVLPMTGWLAQTFGRKRFLIGSVSIFTAASFLCGSAPTLSAMVFYRIVQGAAGGALQPLSQAILLESFPPAERGPAMAVWGMGIVVAPVVAPLLGGYLTQVYTWHWVFLINVPIGILAVAAIAGVVSDPPWAQRRRTRVDTWGIGLLIIGIGALQIVLDRGERDDWFASHFITMLAIASATCLVALVIRELWTRHPVVDLSVFRGRTFTGGTSSMFLFGFALYGTLTLIPLLLQNLLGYPAFQSGLALAPRGIGVIVTMSLAGLLMRRFDARSVILIGVPFLLYSSYQMASFNANIGMRDVVEAMLVQGVGMGFVFVPLTTATMHYVAPEKTTNATGIFNLMRNVGGSVGISTTQTFLARSIQVHHLELGAHVNPYNPVFQSAMQRLVPLFSGHTADVGYARAQALQLVSNLVNAQAAMLGYIQNFWLFAFAFAAIVPLVFLMRPTRGVEPSMAH